MLFFLFPPAQGRSSLMRLLFFYCSLVCMVATISCNSVVTSSAGKSSATAQPHMTVPADLITPGVLTVGSYTSYLPQEYINPATHQMTGFDIELITAMAQRMHLQIKIISDDFSALVGNLLSGRYDVVISAMSITSELQTKVNFIPYFRGGESLLVQKGNPYNIMSLADLCGQAVGVKTESFELDDLKAASAMCKQHGRPEITLRSTQKLNDVIKLLSSKQVVATYQDAPITDYMVKQDPDSFAVGGAVNNQNVEGIVMRKGDSSMQGALEAAFNALKSDGTYHFIIERWGLVSGDITVADHKVKETLLRRGCLASK